MSQRIIRVAFFALAVLPALACNAVVRGGPLSNVPHDNHGVYVSTGGSPRKYQTVGFVQIRGYGMAIAGLAEVGDAQLDGVIRGAMSTEAAKMNGDGVINIEFVDEDPQSDYDKAQSMMSSFSRNGGGVQTKNRYVTVTGEVVRFVAGSSDDPTPPPTGATSTAVAMTSPPPPPAGTAVGGEAISTSPPPPPPAGGAQTAATSAPPPPPPPVTQQPSGPAPAWPSSVGISDRTQCTFRCLGGGVAVDTTLEQQLELQLTKQLGAVRACAIQTGESRVVSFDVRWGPDGSLIFGIEANQAKSSMRDCLGRIPGPRPFRGRPNQTWKCTDYCQ